MTQTDIANLFEALAMLEEIDLNDYETVTGDYFELKQIPLLHGYSLDLITIESAKSVDYRAKGVVYKEHKASVKDTNGQEVGYALLYATFLTGRNPNTVSVQSSGTNSWVASGIPLSWSIAAVRTTGSSSTVMMLSTTATATGTNGAGGSQLIVPYSLQVVCNAGE